jgi:hypothetical protein
VERPQAKWIVFSEAPPKPKTRVFEVYTKDLQGHLGIISWYAPWRRYAFDPSANTVYESQCLRDIAAFCDWLMAERKLEKLAAA